jgi:hypothetical protein
MNDLVQRLSQEDHSVTIGGVQPSVTDLKQRIDKGYIFIKFTETQGGTDLGVRVDKAATDTSRCDFEQSAGVVHVEGTLILNYVKSRCIADIDLATLAGTGRLVALEEVNLGRGA